MKALLSLLAGFTLLTGRLTAAEPYADRLVWVFGWGLDKEDDVTNVCRVLDTASQHGLNGAVVSFGLDNLCKRPPAYFRNLDRVKQVCEIV